MTLSRERAKLAVVIGLALLTFGAASALAHQPADKATPADAAQPQAKPADERREADAIDWDRARNLMRRFRAGEKLSDDERAYLDRAREQRRRQQRPNADRPAAQPGSPAQGESTGMTPLTDLPADAAYKGFDGGLYGRGRNAPPDALLASARRAAAMVQPLDADGKPSPAGRIALISVGMSNTTQEFSTFVRQAQSDPAKSGRVILVDGAQGGRDAADWADPDAGVRPDRPSVWGVLDERLGRAGVTAAQVQVAWIKQARRSPAALGAFPAHAKALEGDLAKIVRRLRSAFPNLRLVYLSSRTYAGYAVSQLNPEPYAFESAFSVRWLIEKQLPAAAPPDAGDAQAAPALDPPILLWGPYLWADGVKGRTIDGLSYTRDDFARDGTHPSDSGRRKVADLLLGFFKTDPTARPWFAAGRAEGQP
jgi:hypothetical protein